MMAYQKYPTSFKTFEGFSKIFQSIPEKDRVIWALNLTEEQLKIANEEGWTVAHELSKFCSLPKQSISPEYVFLADSEGWTVGHLLALNGLLPKKYMTKKVLKTKDFDDYTIAHCLAENGNLPKKFWNSSIFSLQTFYGFTVAHGFLMHIIENMAWDKLTPEIIEGSCRDRDDYWITEALEDLLLKKYACFVEQILQDIESKTLAVIESKIDDEKLRKTISAEIERRVENNVFCSDTPIVEDNTDNIHSRGQDPLYSGQDELYEAWRGR